MTFNEINNQADPIQHHILQEGGILLNGRENAEELMYQSSHYELVASAIAVKKGLEINPNFKIGCMIGFNSIYPATCKPEDNLMAQKLQRRISEVDPEEIRASRIQDRHHRGR